MLPLPAKYSTKCLNLCDKSIRTYLGSRMLRDFRQSIMMLADLLDQLNDSGIIISIYANDKGLNYVLKDVEGNLLPGCQFYGTRDCKASIVLKTAIARAFYYANKQFKPQMEIIK